MKEEYKLWSYLVLLISFIITLLLTIISFTYVGTDKKIPMGISFFVEYHTFFMFFLAIFGIIFGSITQIMTSKKIEINKNKLEVLKKHFKKSFSYEERIIINYLIKNKGVSTQYELTKLEGLNKLKVSRLLIEMKKKELISKEKLGKINKIFLNKELIDIFN